MAPKKPEPLSREQSLEAVVVPSSTLTLKEREDGCLTLGIPFKPSPFVERLSRWLRVPSGGGERPLELDEIGSFVWRMFDSRTTVREMIDRLMAEYKLNRKDAEISLTTFIRTLVRKRLVVLAIENPRRK